MLTDEAKFALKSPVYEHWMRLFTEMLEEWSLRGKGVPDDLDQELKIVTPEPRSPRAMKAVELLKKIDPLSGDALLKYSEYKYLRSMKETGLVRIASASYYDDPSLNHARKDTELESTYFVSPDEIRMRTPYGDPIYPIGPVKISFPSDTDFYVFCLSRMYDYRLFDDFEADACLIIRRPSQFRKRLREAFDLQYPGWEVQEGCVEYYDPFRATGKQVRSRLSKHFRYSYQKEYRIFWLPSTPQPKLDPAFLTLGCVIIHLTNMWKNNTMRAWASLARFGNHCQIGQSLLSLSLPSLVQGGT